MNFKIRQLTENDWREFSEVRLTALKTDPHVFGSNYAKESKMTEADWRGRLASKDNAIFLIYDDDSPVGMTGVSIDWNDPTKRSALLWGSWLAPEARGRGLSELMYQTRIEWAKRQPTIEKIIVSHRASNLSSKFANQKHGFVFTHKTERLWTDGASDDEIFYELNL